MSAGAKPVAERARHTVTASTRDEARRRRRTRRTGRPRRLSPFVRSRSPIPADRPLSPAARLVIDRAIFDFGPDHFGVSDVYAAASGRQADLLILYGTNHDDEDGGGCSRAIQVRDLEDLIETDRIDIAFIGPARAYNRARGWGRDGEPTLGSLGIIL